MNRNKTFRTAIITILLLTNMVAMVYAQDKPSTEKVVIGGKKYLLYTVEKGDTPYSIIKTFKITPDLFELANPELRGSISIGQKIKIPVVENLNQNPTASQPKPQDPDNFIYHSVEKKETVFSISQEYGVSTDELYKYNPTAKQGLKIGEIIQIPKVVKAKPNLPQGQMTIHKVARKETLYSIAKMYGTTQEAILNANPEINSSIRKGTYLKIPPKESPTAQSAEFIDYRLKPGDTYFNLKQRFGISEDELNRYNPQLKDGLKTGITIRLPKQTEVKTFEIKEPEQSFTDNGNLPDYGLATHETGKRYNVGLFLPFGASANDSLKTSSRTSNFLGLYQGALLAVDRMEKAGMKVKLYVYDTWQDPKIVEKLVKKPEFLSLDLIIGPIYPETQKVVSELSAKNRIPMVSALSADEGYVSQNPYFFQVNPSKNLRLTTTADYVAKTYRNDNVIVLNRGNGNAENKLVADKLREKFSYGGILSPNIHFFNIWAEGRDGLENFLKPEKPNIIVMYETNEVNISIAMNRLNSLAKKFPITLVGIQEYTRLQAIDIEYIHNVDFRCLSPYFVDYASSQVNSFIEAYRLEFGAEPTQFSFQGYDATTYFLKALDQASKSLSKEAGVVNPGLLQADYDFQKVSDFGGFMNRTFYVIEYSNNYDVRSVAKIEGKIGGSEN